MEEYVSGNPNSRTTRFSTNDMTSFTSTKLEEKALWTECELINFFIRSIILEIISLSEKGTFQFVLFSNILAPKIRMLSLRLTWNFGIGGRVNFHQIVCATKLCLFSTQHVQRIRDAYTGTITTNDLRILTTVLYELFALFKIRQEESRSDK